jgi:hypothetical protein
MGVVFALQGANVLGGSALMSGNPTYIYVGGLAALVGLVLLILGLRGRSSAHPSPTPTASPAAQPS